MNHLDMNKQKAQRNECNGLVSEYKRLNEKHEGFYAEAAEGRIQLVDHKEKIEEYYDVLLRDYNELVNQCNEIRNKHNKRKFMREKQEHKRN